MWNVRTVQLPTVELQRSEYEDREAAWMAYLEAIETAHEHATTAENDLVIGVDLHHQNQLVEQHWIALSDGSTATGRSPRTS